MLYLHQRWYISNLTITYFTKTFELSGPTADMKCHKVNHTLYTKLKIYINYLNIQLLCIIFTSLVKLFVSYIILMSILFYDTSYISESCNYWNFTFFMSCFYTIFSSRYICLRRTLKVEKNCQDTLSHIYEYMKITAKN